MHYDIITAGVGGQGILSISAIVAASALRSGLFVKQAEEHGMSQRAGAVVSHLRLADHQRIDAGRNPEEMRHDVPAERCFRRALRLLRDQTPTAPALYARLGLAAVQLARGQWSRGLAELDRIDGEPGDNHLV